MSDDTSKTGPQDASRINMNEDYEVRYWTKTLGVSADVLQQAVNEAGPSVEKVRQFLASGS